jgi:hypothetical protein
MKRALAIGILSLFALALIVPCAQGATRIREVRVPIDASPTSPPTPPGTLTLRFVFKNKPRTKNKFTPRQLIRIDFSNVPLLCMNEPGQGTSRLLFTRTLDVAVKLTKAPQPAGKKPKPGRYAFRFSYTFTDFTGTVRGTIDKPNRGKKPRAPRSQGTLSITDLDANPGHTNCTSNGLKQWGGLPLTGVSG